MKIRILVPALLCGLAACSGDRSAHDQPAAEPAKTEARQEAPPVDPLEAARRRVAEVDTMREKSPDRLKMWAKVPGDSALVFVKDTASWPDEMEWGMNSWTDPQGRPIAFAEWPFSETGDEFGEGTHWFDEQGRTVAFEMHVSSFTSGCTEIVRDTRRTLYDPSSFRALSTDTVHTDADGKPIPADCQGQGDWTDVIRPAPTYEALVREGRAPPRP